MKNENGHVIGCMCTRCWHLMTSATPPTPTAKALTSSDWVGGSRDYKAEPQDMAGEYLVELTLQLYARACHPQCSRELHERAWQLVGELKRRVARSQPPTKHICD